MSGKGNSRKNKKTWKTTARGESKAPPSAPSVDKATLPSLTAKSFQELLSDEFGDEEPERLDMLNRPKALVVFVAAYVINMFS